MTFYESNKCSTIFFILFVFVWVAGISFSCAGGKNMPLEENKTSITPDEKIYMPFSRVIVQLHIDSLIDEDGEGKKRHAIAKARAGLFQDLGASVYRVTRVYETIPFVGLEVSPAAFKALKKSSCVVGIKKDALSRTHSH
jgi:hypothetical protein